MIGKNIPHDSGLAHVTGESVFIDDRPMLSNEVHVGMITSPVAKGKLLSVSFDKASSHEDFLGFWTAKHLANKNWGTIVHDQPILVESQISYMDEVIALFACKDRSSLLEIKQLVEIDIEEETPIFSISDAKAKESIIYKAPKAFEQGDVKASLSNAPHTLEGKFICGGQEHFYMESQAALAYPGENGQIEVHASSQHPSETQRVISEALGIPLHHVVCVVKRMGGGFGGKESQAAPIAAYAALVATKLNRAARLILSKDDDMKITGKRHPFENDYKVGFDENGKILGLDISLQADGGAYADLSASILERGMFHADGAYYLKNCSISGICYRTNNHPNTAFRGFGGPQGNMTIESIIEDIAQFLGKDAFEIRKINAYQGNNLKTPYGQVFENNLLPELFSGLYDKSDYQKRLKKIEDFNKLDNGKVKGLSMTATKFGIAFTARFLNQGNALVNVQLDGSVQASTGATEMGQGVNTKIQQIVAHAFGIEARSVQLMTTSTEKNSNTSPTAASSGSDINGAAALKACNMIKGRLCELANLIFQGHKSDDLQEYEIKGKEIDPNLIFENGNITHKKTKQKTTFVELINTAYLNRVSVSGYAHFKTPGLGFSKEKVEGKAFNYFTQGTVVSEVTLCEYTGDLKVDRTDIFMDLGRTLNPGIDQGQVSGAFVQGMGWVTAENLVYSDKGNLLTHSPTTYKIPNIQDTPRVFNIDFIKNDDNDCTVHRSKAVGEPPFILGISVWTAIKNALSFRAKKGDLVNITSPATNEIILNELTRLKEGNGFS